MKKTIVFLVSTLLINVSIADSMKFTASDLNEVCAKSTIACTYYISGFFDGAIVGEYLTPKTKTLSVTALQALFLKEVSAHPEIGNEEAKIYLAQLLIKNNAAEYVKK